VDHGYVELDLVVLAAMTDQLQNAQAERRKRENKAKFWIQNSLDDLIFSKIIGVVPMTNQAYNAITTKSMDTMNLNVGRSRLINTQAEHMSQFMKETPLVGCFFPVTRLKNNTRICGCWTVDATII
jgi:hypothetical protein